MTKKAAKAKPVATAAGGYARLLSDLKQRIRAAQVRTAMASNASMLLLYWEIGSVLAERQKTEGWGTAVLPRLAIDLRNDLPQLKGFSARNLRLMIQFFDEYRAFGPIWQRAVAKLEDQPSHPNIEPSALTPKTPFMSEEAIWQRAVASLTWAHNIILIQKVKHLPTRLWYALQAFEHGWSRDVLSLQIQSQAHQRQGKAVTNFHRTLPPPQSDLATQLLKDPYAYQLTRALPKKLQSALPSIEQIEAELSTKPATKRPKPATRAKGANRKA